jgi:hypothetical protein
LSELGTLKEVSLREAWSHEAHSFTPWLADNLDRLSTAIGIPLELEGQEVSVESFSADILARNPQNDTRVLIENQLEQTDHTHLGQILTYLAGLEAQVVIWVASSFRDPHLSAVKWLNDHTVAPFAFFAVQVKAVRIDDSPIAPLFEIVAKPNDWDRQIQKQVRSTGELSELSKWRLRFWEHLLTRHPEQEEWDGRSATSSHWRQVPNTDIWVSIYISKKEVGLFVRGWRSTDREVVFRQLEPHQENLEKSLGVPIGNGGKSGYFFSQKSIGDLTDESCWSEKVDWLHQMQDLYVSNLKEVL